MPWPVYPVVRNLHLYFGLLVSPFIVLFAVSVFFLVHAWIPGAAAEAQKRSVTNLIIPEGLERMTGREQIAAARAVLEQAGVRGEIGFVRTYPAERRLVVPSAVPGAEAMVDISLSNRTATIATRTTGAWDGTVYLHKMPGPHNVSLRGNALFMQVWRILSDATVYVILFLTLSGVYLWAVLRAERRVGLWFLAAGVASLGSLVYALIA